MKRRLEALLGRLPVDGGLRPMLVLLASNLLGTAVGGVFFLTASWRFSLEQMGVYAVAISVQWVIVGLVGTGLSTATVRLATERLTREDRTGAAGLVLLAFGLSAAASVVGGTVAFGAGRWLESGAFPLELLGFVVLWAGARAALDCVRSGLLAQQQFNRVALLMVLSAVTGLGALGMVLAGGELSVRRMLVAHVFGLGSAAVLGLTFLRPLLKGGVRTGRELLAELLRYARWPAMSEGTRLLQANVGPLVLVWLAGPAQAGLFGLGRYPAYLFEVVAVSFYQYWLPTASRQLGQRDLVRFLGRQTRLAALVGVAMLAGAFAIRPLLPLLGENFAAAAHLFVLNTLDFALFLLVRPAETVYHGLRRPNLELIPRVARLLLVVGLAWPLVRPFGAIGMVWAQIVSGLAALVIAGWVLWRALDPDVRRHAPAAVLGRPEIPPDARRP